MTKYFLSVLVLIATSFSFAAPVNKAEGDKLNKKNIQGEYLVQTKDVFMQARISLGVKVATMTYNDMSIQNLVCKGTYKFDEKKSELKTSFPQCGRGDIEHTLNLSGKSLSALSKRSDISISVSSMGQVFEGLKATIVKLK